jgi:hypothetical protein
MIPDAAMYVAPVDLIFSMDLNFSSSRISSKSAIICSQQKSHLNEYSKKLDHFRMIVKEFKNDKTVKLLGTVGKK